MTMKETTAKITELSRLQGNVKEKPNLSEFICLVDICPTKRKLEYASQQITEYKYRNTELIGQIETFKEKSKSALTIELAKEIYQQALTSEEIKTKENIIAQLRIESAGLQDYNDVLLKEIEQLRKDKDETKSKWEIDIEAKESLKKLNDITFNLKNREKELARITEFIEKQKNYIRENNIYVENLKEAMPQLETRYKYLLNKCAGLKLETEKLDAGLNARKKKLFNLFNKKPQEVFTPRDDFTDQII